MKCPICETDNGVKDQTSSDEKFEFLESMTPNKIFEDEGWPGWELKARIKCKTCGRIFRFER